MGIYLNGIHISRKLSTEKGNYAQRFGYCRRQGVERKSFNLVQMPNKSTKD